MANVLKKDYASIKALHEQRNGAVEAINDLSAELEGLLNAVIEQFNEKHDKTIAKLAEEVEALDVAIATEVGVQTDKMNKHLNARSDRWHESDAGYKYNDWVDLWEDYELNVIEQYHILDRFDCVRRDHLEVAELPPAKAADIKG